MNTTNDFLIGILVGWFTSILWDIVWFKILKKSYLSIKDKKEIDELRKMLYKCRCLLRYHVGKSCKTIGEYQISDNEFSNRSKELLEELERKSNA